MSGIAASGWEKEIRAANDGILSFITMFAATFTTCFFFSFFLVKSVVEERTSKQTGTPASFGLETFALRAARVNSIMVLGRVYAFYAACTFNECASIHTRRVYGNVTANTSSDANAGRSECIHACTREDTERIR